jgi:hypothetical protein
MSTRCARTLLVVPAAIVAALLAATGTTFTCASLMLKGSLKAGCAGLINNGDPATISASYTLTPKQTITSR